MSRFLKGLIAATLLAAPALADGYGLGRPALPDEIAAWDLDVSPDGTGLPPGSGDVATGEELFSEYCAACHGEFAEGIDNWPALAGGWGSLARKDPVKTVGSYWPYLSTVWDYIHRSMPFGNAQSLSHDEVYAITAYILYSNNLVADDFVLSHENFDAVEMPNANGFFVDNRPSVEYPEWRTEPCMEDCKDEVEITMRARVLDVTPVEESAAEEEATEEMAAVNEAAPTTMVETVELDPALVDAGEKVFRKCKACHQIGEGAKNRSGPHLNDVLGRAAGAVDGFRYSNAMQDAGENGLVWTDEDLKAFLAKPRDYLKGTKMSFAGLKDDEDLDAILAYLRSAGG